MQGNYKKCDEWKTKEERSTKRRRKKKSQSSGYAILFLSEAEFKRSNI